CCPRAARAGESRALGGGAGAGVAGRAVGRAAARRGAAGELSRRCAPPRLVAELRDALDACAERQRRLERSLRACRRLLRPWEAAELPAAEPTPAPETQEEAPSPACTPSPQDLKELELLTQTLEKAVRVRKSVSKAAERHKALSLKSGSTAASAPSRVSGQAGRRASETKPLRCIHQTGVPAEGLPECRLLSAGDRTCKGKGARATKPGPGLRDQLPLAAPPAPEVFTLKEKGVLLKLPTAYRKAASQNSRLWTQLSSTQTSDSVDAATNAKTQFLQKMKMASGWPGSGLSAAEVEAEVGLLWKACSLLRQRMEEELLADCADWVQEYHCLLTLEGLQAITGQCLHRLQELRAGEARPHPRPRLKSGQGSRSSSQRAASMAGPLRAGPSPCHPRHCPTGPARTAPPPHCPSCRSPGAVNSLPVYLISEKVLCESHRCWQVTCLARGGYLWRASSRRRREILHPLKASGKEEVPGCHPMRPHIPVLTEMVGQQLGPWPEERCPRASGSCEGRTDPTWSSQLLLYSSTAELQTLAALRLRVAMLEQQIHLEKVLPE
uniref:Tubulin epsilon and delta complex 2 n=1 Tax=Canis lupus familiaris TaxID=9615 RepID=A0A8C0M171_CANLF